MVYGMRVDRVSATQMLRTVPLVDSRAEDEEYLAVLRSNWGNRFYDWQQMNPFEKIFRRIFNSLFGDSCVDSVKTACVRYTLLCLRDHVSRDRVIVGYEQAPELLSTAISTCSSDELYELLNDLKNAAAGRVG